MGPSGRNTVVDGVAPANDGRGLQLGVAFGPQKSHNTKEKAEVAPVLGPRSGPQKGGTCCGEKKPPGLQK